MTDNSIESDEKPCPLTVSDWMAFLAAESQAKFGYKHLVVTILLAVCSIGLMAYAATDFKSFGFFLRLFSATAFCIIFVMLIYYAKLTINTFNQRDKNSEIIEEIISGELTDSNEIRRRYHEQKNTHKPVRETDHRHPHETGQ